MFSNNRWESIGIWDEAIRASMRLSYVDRQSQTKVNFYFDYLYGKEGEYMPESESYQDLVYEAGFGDKDESISRFREMVNTAIEEGILIDVTGKEGVKTQEGYNSYAFEEVLATIDSYLKKDTSKSYGGVKGQAPKETQEAMEKVRTFLIGKHSGYKDVVNTFCSTIVKENPEIANLSEIDIESRFINYLYRKKE